jgi:DNA polymerase III subunit epsilon
VFAAIAQELMDYLEGAEILIHNASFDLGFMDAELRRLGRPRFTEHRVTVTDTLLMAREMFPGKSNSLDALCRRLEVDNSNRSLHGALLDAGLLAEVYIQMTRGQESLVIEAEEGGTAEVQVSRIDLRQFTLPVLAANEAEAAAHEKVLEDLDKSSKGKTLWRRLMA